MAPRVPGERAEPVAEAQSERAERARQPVAAFPERGIGHARLDPARRAFDDLAVGMPFGGVIEELVYCEAVGLHRTFRIE